MHLKKNWLNLNKFCRFVPMAMYFLISSGSYIRCHHLRKLVKRTGQGNGTPLQDSCLENSMDGGAWWATVQGVAESDRTEQPHFPCLRLHGGLSCCRSTILPSVLPWVLDPHHGLRDFPDFLAPPRFFLQTWMLIYLHTCSFSENPSEMRGCRELFAHVEREKHLLKGGGLRSWEIEMLLWPVGPHCPHR